MARNCQWHHTPLFRHPNPYQPIPNPAAFTTIMSMLHKYMAPHGRIPNTTTHIHPHIPIQTYPLWYSQSYIPTVATIPPPPYQTYQTNLGTTENIIEHQNMLWRSRYHPMIMRHTNAQTLMLIIKEAQSWIVHNKFVWIQ